MKEKLLNFLKGCVLGTSIVIPGVSGGTMAVVMNVFDPLMQAFSKKNFHRSLPFLISLGLGVAASILALGNTISWLFAGALLPTTYFFGGVVIGSIPAIYQRLRGQVLRLHNIGIFLAALALMILTTFTGELFPEMSLESTHTVGHILLFMGCGAVAAVTMIMPGISGSLVLTMLGAYRTVIDAVSALDMWVLAPFGIGAIIGCILGVRLMRFLLDRYPVATYAAILGLIVGSVPPILAEIGFAPPDWASVLTLLVGIALCVGFTLWDSRRSVQA